MLIVNSAGISRMNFLIDSPVDEWEAIFKLNVFRKVQLSRAFANYWLGSGSTDRIINIFLRQVRMVTVAWALMWPPSMR